MANDFAPYEFLWIVKESAYGTQESSPVAGVDSIYIRLAGANRFTPRPQIGFVTIPFGGGFAIEGYRKNDKIMITGNLNLELCYTQAHLLLDWAITRINTGQTSPWVTTEPPGDLASCTVYHGIMRDDGTIKRKRYKGVKVHNWKISANSDNSAVMLMLGLQGQKMDSNSYDASSDPDATAFPAPADTAFPTDLALFQHFASNISVGGSALVYPESIEMSGTNAMDPRFFASHFATFDRLRGRKTMLELRTLYTATPDWRSAYEAITAEAVSVVFTNTTHTITITGNAQNVIDPIGDDLQPGKVYDQSFTLNNQWDPSASQDIAFTFA